MSCLHRSHFAAWCISSSPLILGHDLTDPASMSRAESVAANELAIQINQVGHPSVCTFPTRTFFSVLVVASLTLTTQRFGGVGVFRILLPVCPKTNDRSFSDIFFIALSKLLLLTSDFSSCPDVDACLCSVIHTGISLSMYTQKYLQS